MSKVINGVTYFDTNECADFFCIGDHAVRKWRRVYSIPTLKFSGHYWFSGGTLLDWIATGPKRMPKDASKRVVRCMTVGELPKQTLLDYIIT